MTALARLDPQALIARAIETEASIEVLERLLALAKDVRAVQAAEAFHRAMAAFQRDCPPIVKYSQASFPTRSGSIQYSFAPLEDVMEIVQPVLTSHGLTVSWRSLGTEGAIVRVVCRVTHELGHSEESGETTLPVASLDEGRGVNGAQRVGIAKSYARRYSLLDVLGIAPRHEDTDGRVPSRSRAPTGNVDIETGELEAAPATPESDTASEQTRTALIGRIETGIRQLGMKASDVVALTQSLCGCDDYRKAEPADQQKLLADLIRRHRGAKK